MIASAGTRLTRPSAAKEAGDQRRRGAALQQRGEADAGGKCGEAVPSAPASMQTQVRAERAQNAAVDHVQAPQQQRNAAHQVEKNDASHDVRFEIRVESSGYRQMAADQSFYLG